MRVRLPIPASWQDFEAVCHLLWKEIWSDPNAQRIGRPGQNQDGIDLTGRPIYWGLTAGVQCKDRDGRLGSHLTEGQLISALQHAKDFLPRLSQFTLATTGPNDANIQKIARSLAAPDGTGGAVYVWSWDEIEAELLCRPKLMTHFYPTVRYDLVPGVLRIPISAPRDRLQAYFGRPLVASVTPNFLRTRLIQICYELSDNAFAYGNASSVDVSFDGKCLIVKDDGNPFNPLEELDFTKAGLAGHIGSLVLHKMRTDFSNTAEFTYRRDAGVNSFIVRFGTLPLDPHGNLIDITVDTSGFFGRKGAEHYGDSLAIGSDVTEVVLNFVDDFFMSGIHMLIRRVRDRLSPSALLVVSYPRNSSIGMLDGMLGEKIVFRPR